MAQHNTSIQLGFMRIALALLGVIARPLAVAWVYRIWFRSPRYKTPRREIVWRDQARRIAITSRSGRVMTYHWGDADKPRVFLVHGWSGRGTQLGAFVAPLLAAGYSVTSFDAPGHGESDGHSTNLFQIAQVLRQVVLEARQPCALIAHSFGCMVSAYALREYRLPIARLVAISSPTSTNYLIDGFMQTLRLSQGVQDGFLKRFKNEFGVDVFERTAADNNLRNWHGKLLVIHDKDDDIVPWQYGEQLAQASADSEVFYTQSLGHRRILGAQKVMQRVIAFLQGSKQV